MNPPRLLGVQFISRAIGLDNNAKPPRLAFGVSSGKTGQGHAAATLAQGFVKWAAMN